MANPGEVLTALLSHGDPSPVETVNLDGTSDIVLCCEHAGRSIPAALTDLGLQHGDMERHIAYDIGAEPVSRLLSALLDAPLFIQRYSRLVVDCNRPFGAADLIPAVSDGTPVPANRNIATAERQRRIDEIHTPFHRQIADFLDARSKAGRQAIIVAVHSFTPQLRDGVDRPWDLGVLSNRDSRLATALLDFFHARHPELAVAHNRPYVVDDVSDYTIPVHGEGRGLLHALLEIRNDLIADKDGQVKWAGLIADALYAARQHRKVA